MPDPKLLQAAYAAADKYNVPRDLFAALIQQESGWNPQAVSAAGAQGLGQLMPGTARALGVNPLDPAANLDASAKYFSQQFKTFGDERLALAAYNAGPGAVQKYGGVPPYRETQDYVNRIMARRVSYAGAGQGRGVTTPAAVDLSALSLPKTVAAPDLSVLRAAKPAPARTRAAAPDLSALQVPKAPAAVDLSALQVPKPAAPAPTPAPYLRNAPPGALSFPQPGGAANVSSFGVQPGTTQYHAPGAEELAALPGRAIQRTLNIVNTPISVSSTYLNNVARETGKRAAKGEYGGGVFGVDPQAYLDAARTTPWAKVFLSSIKGQTAEFPTPVGAFGEGAKAAPIGQFIARHPLATGALDFVLSFPLLEAVGGAQNEAVSLLGRGARAANRATGASEAILNRIPAVRQMLQNRQFGEAAGAVLNRSVAGMEHYYRDAAGVAEDARATSQRYLKAGAPIRGKSVVTGQPVNRFEELVADYMNTGTQGSKYEGARRTLYQSQKAAEVKRVEAAAASLGVDMADVRRVGDGYSKIFTELGQHLVDTGLLRSEAYDALKGSYLPRLYLMTKGNPGDVSEFLKFLDSEGALTQEAVTEAARQGLTRQWRQGIGPKGFTQGRELFDFEQRNAPELARALVPEATPAALHGIEAQTRAAGLASGMQEIAKNPEWAVPLENGLLPKGKNDWKLFSGKGPLAGYAVHPAVHAVLDAATSPNKVREVMGALFGPKLAPGVMAVNQGIRKAMLSGPKTIANIIVGHYWFAQSEAKVAGTAFSVLDYARAVRELRAFEHTGRTADPYLTEALNRTDLITRGAGLLPKAAKRVSGGVGLETPFQNVVRGAKAAGGKYLHFTHDALAAGKYGLYKQLRRKGLSIHDAARLTRKATIDYTNLPAPIRLADQGMIAPFITFTYRAVPLVGKMAARRPDLFATASGHRFTWYLDRMADKLAAAQGRLPTAQARREQGFAQPADFPIPGATQPGGQQAYARVPLAAPLLHHFLGGQNPEPTDIFTHPFQHLAPGYGLFQDLARNENTRGEQTFPLVPPGAYPPGSLEPTEERVRYVASALLPFSGDVERVVNAMRGTTLHPSRNVPVQAPGAALLQGLTGTVTTPGVGLTPTEKKIQSALRAVQNVRDPATLQFLREYGAHLLTEFQKNRDFTPNPEWLRIARTYDEGKLRTAMKNATMLQKDVITGSKYTGQQKRDVLRRLIDWKLALGKAAAEAGIRDLQFTDLNELPSLFAP